jgi:hypothetical protein
MGDVGMERLGCPGGSVLVGETEPDAHDHDHADHDRIGLLPDEERDTRRDHEKNQDGAAQLAGEHPPGIRLMRSEGVVTDEGEAPGGLDR